MRFARWPALAALAAAGRIDVREISCSPEELQVRQRIVHPAQGAELDVDTDLSLVRNLLVRTQIDGFRLKLAAGYQVVMRSSQESEAVAMRKGGNASFSSFTGFIGEPNFELFGIMEGFYTLWMRLLDAAGFSRDCWPEQVVRFRVMKKPRPKDAEGALLKALRRETVSKSPWMMQPQSKGEFAYVTVLWSNDYVDCVLAWAAGLDAVRSTFRRVCAVAVGTVSPDHLASMQGCCCDIVEIEAVQSPAAVMKGQDNRYGLALTKLRVFQLGRFGLKKIVLMDSDTLVLENIDELFWFPAPAATVTRGALLGETSGPTLSTGVMVIEPRDEDFDSAMKHLAEWEKKAGERDVLRFVEQDLLSMHWLKDGRPLYNVLPLTYNLYPELLDTFPFLDLRTGAETSGPPEAQASVQGLGVKVVHLWHWYNPVLGVKSKLYMQIHAKTRHPLMWQWYEKWWELHQTGFKRIVTEDGYKGLLLHCQHSAGKRHGADSAKHFVPVVGKGIGVLDCMHTVGFG